VRTVVISDGTVVGAGLFGGQTVRRPIFDISAVGGGGFGSRGDNDYHSTGVRAAVGAGFGRFDDSRFVERLFVDGGTVDGTVVDVVVIGRIVVDGVVVVDNDRRRGVGLTFDRFLDVSRILFSLVGHQVDLTQFLVVFHYGGHRLVHFGRVVGLRDLLVLVNVLVVLGRVLGDHLGDLGDGHAHRSVAVAEWFSDLFEHQQLVNGYALEPVVARLFELRQFLVGQVVRRFFGCRVVQPLW